MQHEPFSASPHSLSPQVNVSMPTTCAGRSDTRPWHRHHTWPASCPGSFGACSSVQGSLSAGSRGSLRSWVTGTIGVLMVATLDWARMVHDFCLQSVYHIMKLEISIPSLTLVTGHRSLPLTSNYLPQYTFPLTTLGPPSSSLVSRTCHIM